jgi:hypothetical protein
VRRWIAAHNQEVYNEGRGVRIVICLLPKKSPWLNPIEPKWIHGKRKVVVADRLRGLRVSTLRASIYHRICRLIVH